jgi:hypothetical protein
LSPASLPKLMQCFASKAGAYLSEVFGLKALTTNIRLGRKGIPEAKTVAYYEPTREKHLSRGQSRTGSWGLYYKTFYGRNLRIFVIS